MKLALVAALALLCACNGYTSGNNSTGGNPTGGDSDSGPVNNPDSGGTSPDSGFDAGCTALALNGVGAIDSCLSGPPVTGTATVSVAAPDAGNACTTTISLTTGNGPCVGIASGGSANAFDGGCFGTATLYCTSPSMPGTLTCTGGCTIRICDAGVCGP